MKEGIFFTEASQNVGYGHLMECIAIAEKCRNYSKTSFCLYNSDDKAAEILAEKDFPSIRTGHDSDDANVQIDRDYDWIFMNTRNNLYGQQNSLIARTANFIILDELGNKSINCHSLINFSINDQWHKYEYKGEKTRLFFGPDYYPVRDSLREAREGFVQKNGTVLVTLGGADRTNTTIRLAQIFKDLRDIEVTYVIGPGSGLIEEDLHSILCDAPHQKVVKAPSNFDELMSSHQFIVSSGGNTLYEAAFLKKSILVVWEDAHEKIQGEIFEQRGLARVVGGADLINSDLIIELVADGNPSDEHGKSGPGIVDGQGLNRITSLIKGVAQ